MGKPTRRLVIFDLDETLVHLTEEQREGMEEAGVHDALFVYKRPYVDDLLSTISSDYSLAVWSSAPDEYVHAVVRMIWPPDIPTEFVWGRSACRLKVVRRQMEGVDEPLLIKESHYIKPLDKLTRRGYRMKNLLIVDDTHHKVLDNPGRYSLIHPFEGDPADEHLIGLKKQLIDMSRSEDFPVTAPTREV